MKLTGNEYRNTLVCIDEYDGGRLSGRICNPFLEHAEPFDNLMQMLLKLDSMLDEMQFPQSYEIKRGFAPTQPPVLAGKEPAMQEGKYATFAVRILFRQNASWQGSVQWLNGRQDESFRSALELLFLMNSALESTKSEHVS